MTSRRDFLASSLLAAGAPFVSAMAVQPGAAARNTRFIAESGCGHSNRFAARLASRVDALPGDLVDFLSAFEAELERGALHAVFGLTRDSNQFLLTQIAARYGFRITYSGTHDARNGRMVHTLQGERRSLDGVARRLAADVHGWPATLAELSDTLLRTSASKLRRRVDAGAAPPGDGLSYLTSWTLRRV